MGWLLESLKGATMIPKTRSGSVEKLAILVVVVASIKFLFQGGSISVFGTADASTYAMFLGPVLGAHGFIKGKRISKQSTKQKVDNPDVDQRR